MSSNLDPKEKFFRGALSKLISKSIVILEVENAPSVTIEFVEEKKVKKYLIDKKESSYGDVQKAIRDYYQNYIEPKN